MEKSNQIRIVSKSINACIYCGRPMKDGHSHWAEPCPECLEAVGRDLLLVFPDGIGIRAVSTSINEVERVLDKQSAKRIREKRFGVLPAGSMREFCGPAA